MRFGHSGGKFEVYSGIAHLRATAVPVVWFLGRCCFDAAMLSAVDPWYSQVTKNKDCYGDFCHLISMPARLLFGPTHSRASNGRFRTAMPNPKSRQIKKSVKMNDTKQINSCVWYQHSFIVRVVWLPKPRFTAAPRAY